MKNQIKQIIILLFIIFFKNGFAQCNLSYEKSKAYHVLKVYKTTGDKQLDNFISSYNTDLIVSFGVSADIRIIDSDNAFATKFTWPDGVTANFSLDGAIYLGKKLLLNEWSKPNGDVIILSIIAHEFAHILQNKKGTYYSNSKIQELHADYMAGCFFCTDLSASTDINKKANDLKKAFGEKGDYAYWSFDHHGTPQERMSAIYDGIYDVNEAYKNLPMGGIGDPVSESIRTAFYEKGYKKAVDGTFGIRLCVRAS